MYQTLLDKYNNLDRSRSIVIDASNKCSLQCPKCERQWYVDKKQKVIHGLWLLNKTYLDYNGFDHLIRSNV